MSITAQIGLVLHWAAPVISLVGLVLGVRGVMFLGFRGSMGGKVKRGRLYFRLLFSSRPMAGQPALDREQPIEPWLTDDELAGWRSMARSFTLQALAVVVGAAAQIIA